MEPMWLDSGVEQNDITVENEVYTFFLKDIKHMEC